MNAAKAPLNVGGKMYRVNRETNRVQKLSQSTFGELGFEERRHLQEWIAANPDALGEELLIIQKEFAGFDDTSERLDLLALDSHGNLVVIENKLDDSGRDVTWQALKYASYCSSLSRDQVRDIYADYLRKTGSQGTAEERLSSFLGPAEYDEVEVNTGLSALARKFGHVFHLCGGGDFWGVGGLVESVE